MFWMLFRAFCCLCSNSPRLSNLNRVGHYHYYQDDSDDYDSDENEDTDTKVQARVVKLSNLKRNAIDVTTDVIVAENLLRRHGNDLSLLMYHDKCSKEMDQALDKLPVTSHGAQVKRPCMYKSSCNGVHYTRDLV